MGTQQFHPFDITRPLRIVSPIEDWAGNDEAGMRGAFQAFIAMGISGFVTNVKLDNYLRDEKSWDVLKRGVKLAHEMGLRVWIYDEKGYPSGAAGGLVLERYPQGEAEGLIRAFADDGSPRYEVIKLFENTHATGNFFERRHYPNLLDRKAVATFIDVTHGSYAKALHPIGEYVEAFFTDEPSLIATYIPAGLDYPKTLPWHADLPKIFQERKGYDLTKHWENLFMDTGAADRKVRCDFWEVVADLVAENYFGQVQEWCRAHEVMSSGHLLGEETLVWQTMFDGDPFSSYKRFDLQGIDMILSDPQRIMEDREPFFLVPKVAGSAARLQGKRRVMCEISDFFGMMGGKHATLEQMKCTAGVLMSLGITDFTSYYSVSLNTTQPPDTSLKSRRFSVEEYRTYTDYVSRVNTKVAEGSFVRRTAVLHPIVSVWANFTPPTRSMYEPYQGDRARFIDESFGNLCRELLQHQIEYDIVDEKSLATAALVGKSLMIGNNSYDVVVVPPMDTIRVGTMEKLHRFAVQGGTVLVHPLHPEFAAEGAAQDGHIAKMMAAIIARGPAGGIKTESTPLHYLIRSRIPPLCHLTPSSTRVLCTTLRIDGKLAFFLVNYDSQPYSGSLVFRAHGESRWMDPATGEEKTVPGKTAADGGIQIEGTLAPFGSAFVTF